MLDHERQLKTGKTMEQFIRFMFDVPDNDRIMMWNQVIETQSYACTIDHWCNPDNRPWYELSLLDPSHSMIYMIKMLPHKISNFKCMTVNAYHGRCEKCNTAFIMLAGSSQQTIGQLMTQRSYIYNTNDSNQRKNV